MSDRFRRWVPWLKLALSVAIVGGVVWFFVRVLRSEELQALDPSRTPARILWDSVCAARPTDLLASGALYLAGLGFSGAFWLLLLRRAGEPLPLTVGVRTYYISHLGKYAPLGKGWALLLRTVLSSRGGVRAGVAALTGAYETLTTLAAGALFAAVVLLSQPERDRGQIWIALGLLALAGVPIVPWVFNRVVARLAARFNTDHLTLPRLGHSTLFVGVAMTSCGWFLLGGSLVVLLRTLGADVDPAQPADWLRCTAAVSVAWVAGFVVSTPGGIGPREVLLYVALTPVYGKHRAVLAAILLRILWTVAELVCAGVVYWLPASLVKVQGAKDRTHGPETTYESYRPHESHPATPDHRP
jgi:uncharacterized membrane protein YbhN (UPF0104 family)